MDALNIEDFPREEGLVAVMNGWKPDALVVGGYAASTRSIPRYSVDLDLVLPRSSLDAAREHLAESKLDKVREQLDIEQNYGGSWERWEGGPQKITVDLLVDSVTDRDFQISYSYDELRKDATPTPLIGIRARGPTMVVASREALIALKIQPMRSRDIGDIACLAAAGWDSKRLGQLVARLTKAKPELLAQKLAIFEKTLGGFADREEKLLGPRIPGLARNRIAALTASRKLCDELRRQLP